jgi:hypothetical protein
MARCAVRAAFSGATMGVIALLMHSFSSLNAGWDGAARHPRLDRFRISGNSRIAIRLDSGN